MGEMLTAKDIQQILEVDRSTIYRMAESGRLPALKVGRQWRFPSERIDHWLREQDAGGVLDPATGPEPPSDGDLLDLIPIEAVEQMTDVMADLLGTMIVVTNMEGYPITRVSNPCGLFQIVNELPDAVHRCIDSWHSLASDVNLATRFQRSHLGLLCARAFVRVGTSLKGMVFVGGIAPEDWPPSPQIIEQMADDFGIAPKKMQEHIHEVYHLDGEQREQLLPYVSRIATTISLMARQSRNS